MNKDKLELLPEVRRQIERGKDWKPNEVFARLVVADDFLVSIVGPEPMTRHELGRRLWDYIGRNNLQDAGNRRLIHCDAAFSKIFDGSKDMNVMELMRRVSSHVKQVQ